MLFWTQTKWRSFLGVSIACRKCSFKIFSTFPTSKASGRPHCPATVRGAFVPPVERPQGAGGYKFFLFVFILGQDESTPPIGVNYPPLTYPSPVISSVARLRAVSLIHEQGEWAIPLPRNCPRGIRPACRATAGSGRLQNFFSFYLYPEREPLYIAPAIPAP